MIGSRDGKRVASGLYGALQNRAAGASSLRRAPSIYAVQNSSCCFPGLWSGSRLCSYQQLTLCDALLRSNKHPRQAQPRQAWRRLTVGTGAMQVGKEGGEKVGYAGTARKSKAKGDEGAAGERTRAQERAKEYLARVVPSLYAACVTFGLRHHARADGSRGRAVLGGRGLAVFMISRATLPDRCSFWPKAAGYWTRRLLSAGGQAPGPCGGRARQFDYGARAADGGDGDGGQRGRGPKGGRTKQRRGRGGGSRGGGASTNMFGAAWSSGDGLSNGQHGARHGAAAAAAAAAMDGD